MDLYFANNVFGTLFDKHNPSLFIAQLHVPYQSSRYNINDIAYKLLVYILIGPEWLFCYSNVKWAWKSLCASRIPDILEFTMFIDKLKQKKCLPIPLSQLREEKVVRYQGFRILLLACGCAPNIHARNCLRGFTKRLMTGPIINGFCQSNNSSFLMKVNISH